MLHQAPEIPNYTIISPLGSGTSGHVWLAKDIYGERRAIKVLHFDYVDDPEYQRRFKREVTAQQQLFEVSSHVARIFDYDEKHLPPYIVMDYIRGMDLNRLIATKEIAKFELMTRLHWIEAIASTLTKAHSMRIPGHSHGIIHRDIKPQNIRIQGERPYLLDFSISLTSDVEVDSTQDAMTLRYASPEMQASEAADIFSFGLVVFEILYESHPLTSYDEATKMPMIDYPKYVLHKLIEGDWQYPSKTESKLPPLNTQKIRQQMDAIFQKVLAVDPTDRYASVKNFSDDILAVLLGPMSSPAFRVYSSRTTTEIPKVPLRLDLDEIRRRATVVSQESSIETEKTPQSTRRFTKTELQDMAMRTDADAPQPVNTSSDEVKVDEAPRRHARDNDIAYNELDKVETIERRPVFELPKQQNRLPMILGAVVLLLVVGFIIISSTNMNPAILTGAQLTASVASDDGTSVAVISTSSSTAEPASTIVNQELIDGGSATQSEFSAISQTTERTTTLLSDLELTPDEIADAQVKSSATLKVTATDMATTTATETNMVIPEMTATRAPSATPRPSLTPVTIVPTATDVPPTATIVPSPSPEPEAWEIKQDVLTVNDINTPLPVVFVPAGCMTTAGRDELCLDEDVWVDLEPVSNEKYDLCSRSGMCSRPAFGEQFDPAGAGATNPVVGVNLAMATQYCEWRDARLPSSTEWEILMTKLPSVYHDYNEWTTEIEPVEGQSKMYTLGAAGISAVWVEDGYLSEDLTFRCVQDG